MLKGKLSPHFQSVDQTKMYFSSSNDKKQSNGGDAGIPKSKSKFESLMKPDLVKITDKSIVLTKIKKSRGKQDSFYAYKVQKLHHKGTKKPSSLSISKKTRKAEEPKDMFRSDSSTSSNTNDDLTSGSSTSEISYDIATQNNGNGYENTSNEDFLCIWNSSTDSELTDNEPSSSQDLNDYLYLENQTMDASLNLTAMQLAGQDNCSTQDTELKRYGNKSFRSQETSTDDLFKFRKLSPFASTILHKCHELEDMQFNAPGSSSQVINRNPPTLTAQEPTNPTIQMSRNNSNQMLGICEGAADWFPTREPNQISMFYWLKPIGIVTIIAILVIILATIYIRFQLRAAMPPPPPKPFWRQYLSNLSNLIYFYN